MTVSVLIDNGVTDEFTGFDDHFIKHSDGSLEVVRAGTAPPQSYPAGSWIDVGGDGTRERRRFFRHG